MCLALPCGTCPTAPSAKRDDYPYQHSAGLNTQKVIVYFAPYLFWGGALISTEAVKKKRILWGAIALLGAGTWPAETMTFIGNS